MRYRSWTPSSDCGGPSGGAWFVKLSLSPEKAKVLGIENK